MASDHQLHRSRCSTTCPDVIFQDGTGPAASCSRFADECYLSMTNLHFLEYTRMMHPAECKMPNSVLNNAIGNVFASEKRDQGRKAMEKRLSTERNNTVKEDKENLEYRTFLTFDHSCLLSIGMLNVYPVNLLVAK